MPCFPPNFRDVDIRPPDEDMYLCNESPNSVAFNTELRGTSKLIESHFVPVRPMGTEVLVVVTSREVIAAGAMLTGCRPRLALANYHQKKDL